MNNRNSPDLLRYASAGTEFILTFGLFLAGGVLLDRWLGLSPILTLVGTLAGFAGALYRLVRSVKSPHDRPRRPGQ